MLDKAHVRQPRTSRPLRRTLHNLDALDQRTVHLVPHLDTHTRELPAQQNRRVDATAPNVDADAREGIAGPLPHEQDVADTRALGILLGEEAGSGGARIEDGFLGGGYGCDGMGAYFLDVGGCGCEDGDAKVFT
jgi:hypothetical protein